MDWREFFLEPAVVWVVIPVLYIVFEGIKSLFRLYYEHVERLEMIQQGIVPPDRTAESECGEV